MLKSPLLNQILRHALMPWLPPGGNRIEIAILPCFCIFQFLNDFVKRGLPGKTMCVVIVQNAALACRDVDTQTGWKKLIYNFAFVSGLDTNLPPKIVLTADIDIAEAAFARGSASAYHVTVKNRMGCEGSRSVPIGCAGCRYPSSYFSGQWRELNCKYVVLF